MSDLEKHQSDRRKVVTLLGTGAIALPTLGLSACGGGEEASAPAQLAADTSDAAEQAASSMQEAAAEAGDAMESMAETAQDEAQAAMESAEAAVDDTMDAAADAVEEAGSTIATDATAMAQVDENGAQAKGLAYRHDATTVDSSAQPRYQAGQQCSNCVLFQGGDAEWGGCPLFAGQQVKATGWCSAYSAAS